MRSSVASAGRWWASAGCLGLVIASAFICATLYLGGERVGEREERGESWGRGSVLSPGPDPMSSSQGPALVRRKGSPRWTEVTTQQDLTTRHQDPSTPAEELTTPPEPTTTPQTTTSTTTRPQHHHHHAPHHHHATHRHHARHRVREDEEEERQPAGRVPWGLILSNVNKSRDSSLGSRLSQRLKELSELDPAKLIKNTSSLVSFGLLAVDLFLLHNVQRIAFTEKSASQISNDPEVVALNSLFGEEKSSGGREGRGGREDKPETGARGVVGEVMGYLKGAVRGALNLGRAYRESQQAGAQGSEERGPQPGPSPLDCIWTLYCRSLDKTANLSGPYGFLAKMNRLGLKLMLGEMEPSDAAQGLMNDVTTNKRGLDCSTLFPRCSVEEAKRVVLATAQG